MAAHTLGQTLDSSASPSAPTSTDAGRDGASSETHEPSPAPAGQEQQARDPFFDNAKFLAILLVVAGHAIVDLRDVPLASAAYLFIYMFHMPVFIVLTGYMSRNFALTGDRVQKLVTTVVVPYVILETAYSVFSAAMTGSELELSLLEPFWVMWFLVALFIWRVTAPLWQRLRWPLAIAVAISLASGLQELPNELDLHRVLGMLPYFVLGMLLRPWHFEMLRRPLARVAGVLVIACGLGLAFVADHLMSTEWVYWRRDNAFLAVDDITGTAMRLAMLVAGVTLVAAFLTLVPNRRTWFTGLGAATLYAYLLHGFLVRTGKYLGWYDLDWLNTIPGVLGTAVAAVALGTLLTTPPVRAVTRWVLEPRMRWAFLQRNRAESR